MELGDAVVFKDEYKRQCVGRVTSLDAWGEPGMLLIKLVGSDSHGAYQRGPSTIRLAEDWEVHQAGLHEGVLA
jgi:hypothetical protein